jgi:resuscitation-promoting factor RpfB
LPKPASAPDYNKVLIALHTAQTVEKAQQAALEAAQEAQQAAEAQAAIQAQQVAYTAPTQVAGDCGVWLAQAGVADIADAMTIIGMESGCNPYAVNASSGACGVAQELPCGKSGCAFADGACEVAWMNNYVLERYGSWANAVAFHYANGYY